MEWTTLWVDIAPLPQERKVLQLVTEENAREHKAFTSVSKLNIYM